MSTKEYFKIQTVIIEIGLTLDRLDLVEFRTSLALAKAKVEDAATELPEEVKRRAKKNIELMEALAASCLVTQSIFRETKREILDVSFAALAGTPHVQDTDHT